MAFLQGLKNLLKPAPQKLKRERDLIKPFKGNYNDMGIFTFNTEGFTITLKDGTHAIQWHNVEKLTGYKIDLMEFDEICLNIVTNDGSFTISEDTPGWYQFLEKTKVVFPVIDKHWDATIVYPSFATNLTILYEKPHHA
jgi:hypothetical protein